MAGWIGSPGFITAVALERKQRHMDPHLSISGADPVSLFWRFSRGKGCNSPRLVGGQISPLEHLFCKEKIRFTLFLMFVWNMHKPGHAASAFQFSFSFSFSFNNNNTNTNTNTKTTTTNNNTNNNNNGKDKDKELSYFTSIQNAR